MTGSSGLPNSAPSPALSPEVQNAIAGFEASSQPGVWAHLSKATIVSEMRSRVSDPFKINQGQQPFCGPASVIFELVRKQPLRYVQICRSLFESGSFQGRSRPIAASSQLRQASKGNLQMGQADWMLLATLRDVENIIFPVDPDAPEIVRNLGGMTKSWELKGWVEEVLGYRNVRYKHTYLLGDMAILREAADVIHAGGVAMALITADGFLKQTIPTKAELPVAMPNHWITLLGNIKVEKGTFGQHDSGHVSFDVYSWARKFHIEADEGPFERYFWGVVLGQP